MNLSSLQATLRTFAAERRWEPFHTPKNLAMALMVEAAELAEIFQWMTPEESIKAHGDKVVQDRIADEVADVLLYLLQLADHSAIDLKRAVGRKLVKNAKKHPPTAVGAKALAVAPIAPHAHVLVDWENVQPTGEDIQALVPDATDLWVFHGRTQRNIRSKLAAFDENLTLIPIARTGKNALDFHLSFYMGYVASRNPDARFVVVSNDQGYGPMLDHARDLGFAASQVGWTPQRTAARKSAARPAAKPATRRAAAKAPAASRSGRSLAPAVPVPAAAPQEAAPVAAAPSARRASTRRKAAAPLDPASAEALMTDAPVAPEAQEAPVKTTARKSTAKSTGRTPAAKKVPARRAAAPVEPPAPDVRQPASAARRRSAAEAASEAGAAPARTTRTRTRKSTAAPAAPAAPAVSDKAYAHVLASLRKARDKPARTARLYSAVRSLLEGGKAGDAAVEAVVQRMIADGHASPDGRGGVRLTV